MSEYPITGGTFQAPYDWREYLRAVIAGRDSLPTFDLNLKYDYAGNDRLWGQLYEELKGTGEDVKMADAALYLVEHGTLDEMKAMQKAIPYEEAPNALDRIVALYDHHRDRLASRDMVYGPLWNALQKWPTHDRLLQTLKREVEQYRNKEFYTDAAKSFPDWFAQNLRALVPQVTGDELLWILAAPDDKRQHILEALATAGPAYVQSVIADVNKRGYGPEFYQSVRHKLRAHPVFARALDEAQIK